MWEKLKSLISPDPFHSERSFWVDDGAVRCEAFFVLLLLAISSFSPLKDVTIALSCWKSDTSEPIGLERNSRRALPRCTICSTVVDSCN